MPSKTLAGTIRCCVIKSSCARSARNRSPFPRPVYQGRPSLSIRRSAPSPPPVLQVAGQAQNLVRSIVFGQKEAGAFPRQREASRLNRFHALGRAPCRTPRGYRQRYFIVLVELLPGAVRRRRIQGTSQPFVASRPGIAGRLPVVGEPSCGSAFVLEAATLEAVPTLGSIFIRSTAVLTGVSSRPPFIHGLNRRDPCACNRSLNIETVGVCFSPFSSGCLRR